MLTLTEEAEKCCERAWTKAALAGALDRVEQWQCPKCEAEYRVRTIDVARYFEYDAWCRRL